MPQLRFENVPGKWSGNDYKNGVSMTKVSMASGPPVALIFMSRMSIDFDGMANAYGPVAKCPLDTLENAGKDDYKSGYYGLKAYDPKFVPKGVKLAEPHSLYKDPFGRVPAVRQGGFYDGFFISVTSRGVDAGVEPFGVLHGSLAAQGVADGNYGLVLRPDKGLTADYKYLAGEGGAIKDKNGNYIEDHRLGECSYKVFLDIGGPPKLCSQKYPWNGFPTTFIVFPGSNQSTLLRISLGDDYSDLAAFLAIQANVDLKNLGVSGLPAFNKYVADGRKTKPSGFSKVAYALQLRGYLLSAPLSMSLTP